MLINNNLPPTATQLLLPEVVSTISEYATETVQEIPTDYSKYLILESTNHIRRTLFETLSAVDIDKQQTKTTDRRNLHLVQLRTRQLEDFALLQCFLSYCRIDILFQETSNDFFDVTLPLCLPSETDPNTSSCPLIGRVNRLLLLTASNEALNQHIHAPNLSSTDKPFVFLPVTTGEPLHLLSTSIIQGHKEKTLQKIEDTTPHAILKLLSITSALKFFGVTCFLALHTVLKVTKAMLSVVLFCAIITPACVLVLANYNGKLNWTNCTYSLVSSYIFCFATLGALGGFLYSGKKTLPYVKELWQTRHQIFQLYTQSLPSFGRLWVDYTNKKGYISGSKQLISDLRSNTVPDLSIVRQL